MSFQGTIWCLRFILGKGFWFLSYVGGLGATDGVSTQV